MTLGMRNIHDILEVGSHGNRFTTTLRIIEVGLVLGDGDVRVYTDSNHSILVPRYWNGTSIPLVAQQIHCNVTCIGRRKRRGEDEG